MIKTIFALLSITVIVHCSSETILSTKLHLRSSSHFNNLLLKSTMPSFSLKTIKNTTKLSLTTFGPTPSLRITHSHVGKDKEILEVTPTSL
jgi:hypothetical protein